MLLKHIPTSLLIIFLATAGCDSGEVTRLKDENDSLQNELLSQQVAVESLRDITIWLDSIDINRNLLLINFATETSHPAFSARMSDINEFVKRSGEKIRIIEDAIKSSTLESSAYLMLVSAFKSEMQLRVDELRKLNEQVRKYKDENAGLNETIKVRQNEVSEISRQASAQEQELLLLEARIQAMVKNIRVSEAHAYYTRARAVEETAKRTRFAPHKRRETYKEALALYKKALSLGKTAAGDDITRLEKTR